MQSRRAGLQQLLAHLGDHFLTELADGIAVVAVGFELFANPARNFRAAHVRETNQVGEIDDGHDARDHRNGNAHFLQPVDEVEVAVRVEEVLGDGAVGTGLNLAGKVLQIFFGVAGLRMKLRVRGYFQVKRIAAVLTDKLHQLVGVAQLTGGTHTGGHVAP